MTDIGLMTDILAIMGILFIILQKTENTMLNVQCSVQVTINDFQKIAHLDS